MSSIGDNSAFNPLLQPTSALQHLETKRAEVEDGSNEMVIDLVASSSYISGLAEETIVEEAMPKALVQVDRRKSVELESIAIIVHSQEVMKNMRSHLPSMKMEGIATDHIQDFVTDIYHAEIRALATAAESRLEERGIFSPIGDSWTMIGLGSLGRGDVNPYSDIDFAILVSEDSEEVRSYFQELVSEISLLTDELKDKGLQLCPGGVVPPYQKEGVDKGSKELIGTPSELSKRTFSKILQGDKKMGLAAYSLLQTGFIHGDKKIFDNLKGLQRDMYRSETERTPKSESEEKRGKVKGSRIGGIIPRKKGKVASGEKVPENSSPRETYGMVIGKKILSEGLDFWVERKQLENLKHDKTNLAVDRMGVNPRCDIKKAVLRPIQNSIHGLSVYHGVHESNTYKAIDILAEKGVLTKELARDIKWLYRATNGIRLRIELESQQEKILVTRHPTHEISKIINASLITEEEYAYLSNANVTLNRLRERIDPLL